MTDEISEAMPAVPPKQSFSKRLRAALETLEEGNMIRLLTREDRQTITNAVLATKKKMGYNLTTHMAQGRNEEGKMVIEIKRQPPLANETEQA